ncbi:MAG: hypothetical protein ACRBCI_00015 [Cellvibrionaceae bacterium]
MSETGDEDKLMEAALDAGADDILTQEDGSIFPSFSVMISTVIFVTAVSR